MAAPVWHGWHELPPTAAAAQRCCSFVRQRRLHAWPSHHRQQPWPHRPVCAYVRACSMHACMGCTPAACAGSRHAHGAVWPLTSSHPLPCTHLQPASATWNVLCAWPEALAVCTCPRGQVNPSWDPPFSCRHFLFCVQVCRARVRRRRGLDVRRGRPQHGWHVCVLPRSVVHLSLRTGGSARPPPAVPWLHAAPSVRGTLERVWAFE